MLFVKLTSSETRNQESFRVWNLLSCDLAAETIESLVRFHYEATETIFIRTHSQDKFSGLWHLSCNLPNETHNFAIGGVLLFPLLWYRKYNTETRTQDSFGILIFMNFFLLPRHKHVKFGVNWSTPSPPTSEHTYTKTHCILMMAFTLLANLESFAFVALGFVRLGLTKLHCFVVSCVSFLQVVLC